MVFASLRIITDDIKRLVQFLEQATGLPARWYTDDFAELATSSCTLAIGSTRTMSLFGERVAHPANNKSAIIEFRVENVDAEYEKIKALTSDIVQKPTTMP